MNKLSETLELQIVSSDDKEKQGDLLASFCGVLQVIIQKLSSVEETKRCILEAADCIMLLFLRVFACRSSTVHEEAMLAIDGVAEFEEYQVCAITIGVVGDICRALDDTALQYEYCAAIMSPLMTVLSSEALHRSVKPPLFSAFGAIALTMGEHFEKYTPSVVYTMQEAARLGYADELLEYGNQLKCSIFEAFSGMTV
ncbi:importin subunit beta-1 [Prunus yedoensis var. nudiflora]|uniref:Importin subunit beta-1 n=1 Tax=Prunus yedoensis var. nudiflora TaxID=2094558 RepID=A0A314YVH2_PRUYE|nr:importin subunit beta-1 [Prunus yedoensis var. nudiflora]